MLRAAGKVPGLREAVGLLPAVPAVEVGHDRHRPAVWRLIGAMVVAPGVAAGRIGPVQRLVDGQQVRQEPALCVHQAVDPLDPDRPAPARLDGERRVVERARVVDRPIAPHRGRRQAHARRQDALAELTHSDLEVLDAPVAPPRDRARPRHGRGNHQRRLVLRDRARVEHPDRRLMRERLAPRGPPQHHPRAGTRPVLEKPSSRDRAHEPDPPARSAPSTAPGHDWTPCGRRSQPPARWEGAWRCAAPTGAATTGNVTERATGLVRCSASA